MNAQQKNSIPTENLSTANIVTDGDIQVRVGRIDANTRAEYAEVIRSKGWRFPPVVVFYDGEQHVLADGFHRHLAAVDEGLTEIPAEVRPGTKRDALLYACGANADHGLRRTSADKRKAIRILLEDPEWSEHSSNWIAKQVRCSSHTVEIVRLELSTLQMQSAGSSDSESPSTLQMQSAGSSDSESPSTLQMQSAPGSDIPPPTPPKVRKTSDGREMDTSKIGKTPRKKKRSGRHPAVDAVNKSQLVTNALRNLREVEQHLEPKQVFKLCEHLRNDLAHYLEGLGREDEADVVAKVCAIREVSK